MARRWVFWAYEVSLAALAAASVWLLTQPDELEWVENSQTVIWALFVADYLARIILARDRKRFLREHILELIAILPLDMLRVARMARLFRLLRVAVIIWRISRDLRQLLTSHGLGYALTFAGMLILAGGGAISVVEPEIGSLPDGIWWAIVTMTTVGYGDIAPTTAAGRTVATLLLLVGIAVMGMLTASLTTFFMAPRTQGNPAIVYSRAKLDQWDDLSAEQRSDLAIMLRTLAEKDETHR